MDCKARQDENLNLAGKVNSVAQKHQRHPLIDTCLGKLCCCWTWPDCNFERKLSWFSSVDSSSWWRRQRFSCWKSPEWWLVDIARTVSMYTLIYHHFCPPVHWVWYSSSPCPARSRTSRIQETSHQEMLDKSDVAKEFFFVFF